MIAGFLESQHLVIRASEDMLGNNSILAASIQNSLTTTNTEQ